MPPLAPSASARRSTPGMLSTVVAASCDPSQGTRSEPSTPPTGGAIGLGECAALRPDVGGVQFTSPESAPTRMVASSTPGLARAWRAGLGSAAAVWPTGSRGASSSARSVAPASRAGLVTTNPRGRGSCCRSCSPSVDPPRLSGDSAESSVSRSPDCRISRRLAWDLGSAGSSRTGVRFSSSLPAAGAGRGRGGSLGGGRVPSGVGVSAGCNRGRGTAVVATCGSLPVSPDGWSVCTGVWSRRSLSIARGRVSPSAVHGDAVQPASSLSKAGVPVNSVRGAECSGSAGRAGASFGDAAVPSSVTGADSTTTGATTTTIEVPSVLAAVPSAGSASDRGDRSCSASLFGVLSDCDALSS